jgi:hypothetical protein
VDLGERNSMRIVLIMLLWLSYETAAAQEFSYPVIQASAKTMHDFVPVGWMLLDSATGDLNNDKQADLAFIIQDEDSVTLIESKSGSHIGQRMKVLTQPRILVIAFFNLFTRNYDVIMQNDSFILCHDDAAWDDPFVGMSITKGVIKMNFRLLNNKVSWVTINTFYSFQYRDSAFILTEADYISLQRVTGEIEEHNYNFVSRKEEIISGENVGDTPSKGNAQWKKIDIMPLKTFKTFTRPFTWQVEKDIYL